MKSGIILPDRLINMVPSKPLMLFDGVCNLCQGGVQFYISHDKSGKIMFASLQSALGREVSQAMNFKEGEMNTMLLIENGRIYTQSDAALNTTKYLDGGWKILRYLKIFPKFLRDFVYGIVAKNRYRWFGKQNECWLPTPDLKKRFA